MTIFLLYFLNVAGTAGQSALCKHYASHRGDGTLFNISKAFSALVIFAAVSFISGFSPHIPTLLFGMIYGIMRCASMYTGFKALAIGPMALTSTIASFSLIIPLIFGLCFLKESLSFIGIIGIIFLFISIVLINNGKAGKASVKWSVFSILTLVFNGMCSVIQKIHQIYFPSLYINEFMLCSMFTVSLIMFCTFSFSKRDDKKISLVPEGIICGILKGTADYVVLYLAAFENATVLFPIVSAASTVAIWLLGRFVFKEKTTPRGLIGLVLGITAVILIKFN